MTTEKTKPRVRIRGIPAKTLTSQGYAVCLFPEQPRRETITEQDRSTEEILEKTIVQTVEASEKPKVPELEYVRVHWKNRLVYLVAFISFTLSFNNVYHFPLNVYRYGDKFLLPYTIFTVIIGYPFHVLQTSMGQYSQRGIFWVWECAPLASGVGVAMLIACMIISLYYNLFAAYSLVYFSHCFNWVLPWSYCTQVFTKDETCAPRICSIYKNFTSPSKHYFYNNILNTPQKYPPEDGFLGPVKWWLILALFFSWFVVYIATLRSARSIGKIAIFIVIFSYFSLLMLLILVLQLKDSGKGLGMAFSENNKDISILSFEIWTTAAVQVVLELGLCYGIPLVYGSYRHFRNVIYLDSFLLCLINYLNSILFFILFYCFLGTLACDIGGFPRDIVDNSYGLIYIIYSEAIAPLKWRNFWCLIFFLMLFCIALGTQIAIAETIMTVLYDKFLKLSNFRWFINIFICSGLFLLGIIFCTANGFYELNLLDTMPIFLTVLILLLLFAVNVIIVYSISRYFEDMEIMFNRKPYSVIRIGIQILTIVLLIITILSCFKMHPSSIGNKTYHGKYLIVAWCVFGLILSPFIISMIVWIVYSKKQGKNIKEPSDSWKIYRDKTKQGKDQFSTEYSSIFTWPWCK